MQAWLPVNDLYIGMRIADLLLNAVGAVIQKKNVMKIMLKNIHNGIRNNSKKKS